MREDYQALIDEVCALLGTPATLEGRDFSLIAFGAHEGDGDGAEPALDPVRRRSILGRRSSAEVRRWFESFGITRATGPVRIDPEPSAGVEHGRICLPVRNAGVVHGYIWLMDDGALDLADPRLESAMTVASRIGTLLAAEAGAEARTGELLRALLTADDRGASEEAASELSGLLGPAAAGPVVLLAVLPWRAEDAGGGGGGDDRGTGAGGGPGGAPHVGTGGPVPQVTARCVLPATGTGGGTSAGTTPVTSAGPAAGEAAGPAAGEPVLAALVR
ncbi:PucR family transcriptional regulator, partial [Streptomyces abyssalis]